VPAITADGNPPPATREYVTDTGRRVRDHRADDGGVPTLFPAPLPPEERTMSSVLLAAVTRQLAPKVRACGQAALGDAPGGTTPTVMVTLQLDVAGGRLTATRVDAAPIGIAEAHAAALIACVKQRLAGLSLASGDEPARMGYVAHFPIRLR
jgi:hypothetical protein